MLITFVAFVGLLSFTLINPRSQLRLRQKSRESWILDLSGLWVQGLIIPWLQIALVMRLYGWLVPDLQASLALHPLLGFLLSVVAVDYLYYWNHRLLHVRSLWFIHRVHHTLTDLDVLGTSRNTLWSSVFIVYLWVHALFIFWLADPTWYIIGVGLSNALDLWRHSEAHLPDWLGRWLSPWLILPIDHAAHHHRQFCGTNFGANLKVWDWLHGTLGEGRAALSSGRESCDLLLTEDLGIPVKMGLMRQLLLPF